LLTALQDQFVVLPLRLPVTVYSGIHPPPELLAALANPRRKPSEIPPRKPPRPTASSADIKAAAAGATAGPPVSPAAAAPPYTATSNVEAAPGYEEAPPSYEDAVAGTMAPVQGPRGDYAPPPSGGEDERFRGRKN
jgi:hypothetical protein